MTTNRSPNYPRVNLRAAIELVRKIYTQHEKREFTSAEAAAALGNKPGSGGFQKNIAALRQFGLVAGRGSNTYVTQRGIKLARGNQEGSDYLPVLREAALAPPLFRQMQDLGPKSPGALTDTLVMEMGFSEAGASSVVSTFQQTMEFAKVDEAGESTEADEPEETYDEEVDSQPAGAAAPDVQGERTKMSLALPDGGIAQLNLPPTMTSQSWNHFMAVVQALKTGLVQDNHGVEVMPNDHRQLPAYRVVRDQDDGSTS